MSNAFARVSAGRVALLGVMTAGLVASGSAVAFASTAVPATSAAPAAVGFWHHHHHHHHWFGYGFAPYAGGRHFDDHHSYNHHHHHWYEHKLETWRGGEDTNNRGLDGRRSSDDFGFCGCGDDHRDGFRDGGFRDGGHPAAVTPGEAPAAAPAAAPAEAPAEAPATAPASTPAAGSTTPSK